MKDAFAEVERIWARCVTEGRKDIEGDILDLLKDQGIGIRRDDGSLKQVTLSIPTLVNSAYVIGLRYIKRDGTQTEDLIPVEKGRSVEGCYKGSLQARWPEYDGTHRQQIVFAIVADEPPPTTAVNTISMVKRRE